MVEMITEKEEIKDMRKKLKKMESLLSKLQSKREETQKHHREDKDDKLLRRTLIISKFDGNSEKLEEWITGVELEAEAALWRIEEEKFDQALAKVVGSKLSSSALAVYMEIKRNKEMEMSWTNFKKKLVETCQDADPQEKLRQQFLNLKTRDVVQYTNKMIAMFTRIEDWEQMATTILLNNLNDEEIRKQVAWEKPTTFQQAIGLIRQANPYKQRNKRDIERTTEMNPGNKNKERLGQTNKKYKKGERRCTYTNCRFPHNHETKDCLKKKHDERRNNQGHHFHHEANTRLDDTQMEKNIQVISREQLELENEKLRDQVSFLKEQV